MGGLNNINNPTNPSSIGGGLPNRRPKVIVSEGWNQQKKFLVRKIFSLFLIVMTIVIVSVFFYLFYRNDLIVLHESDLIAGDEIGLEEGQEIQLEQQGEKVSLKMVSKEENNSMFVMEGGREIIVEVDGEKKVDTDNDGVKDLVIEMNRGENGSIAYRLQKIESFEERKRVENKEEANREGEVSGEEVADREEVADGEEEENGEEAIDRGGEANRVEKEAIFCKDIPEDFVQQEAYLENNPEVKESLLCISEAFSGCEDSNITFLGEQTDSVLSIKKENNKCIIDYRSGRNGMECEYSLAQVRMLHEASVENNHPELTGLGVASWMGMELSFNFKAGEETEKEITNKDTGRPEKISCLFYTSSSYSSPNKTAKESETIEKNSREYQTKKYEDGVIYWDGQAFEENKPYYEDSESCIFSIYFSKEILESEDYYLTHCIQRCEETGGKKSEIVSLNDIDSQGHGYIFAYECVCDKC